MKLSLLGSTGSIGTQALEVLRYHGMRPVALAARRSVSLLESQAREFLPELCAVSEEDAGRDLRARLADTSVKVIYGTEAIIEAVCLDKADTVLNALVGLSGLMPTLAALSVDKRLLLANKESLVYGGELVIDAAKQAIVPVDSEHSAIFQCLEAGRESVKRLHLTASGGPFRTWTTEQMKTVTPEMALRHPNWSMGAKITVDSATMLNKGLEVIEAQYLFNMSVDNIDVIVHPESIVHSMVEYNDGAVLAQLGLPDMRLPIQYALTYPQRLPCPGDGLNLTDLGKLTFEKPDFERFPCLELSYNAAKRGGNAPAILSSSGEAAVEDFLQERITFTEISKRIAYALENIPHVPSPTPDDLFETDRLCRNLAMK